MSNETDKMNYCCDCGWAIRKGFIFKTWYCTCPEIMEKLKKVEISPVNGIKTIEKEKKIECTDLRGPYSYSHLEMMPDGRKFCKNYKGQLRGHPAIPPRATPRFPEAPPMPKRVAKAMEEHDAAYLMNQKQKKLEAENKLLKEDIKRMVTTLKHHCNHFITLKLCDCFTNRMGSRGCVYKRSDGCDIADFINKYDGKEGNK